jgi:spore germination protein PE
VSRVSSVRHINIVEVGTTSILEIGDSKQVEPVSFAIAVQRERAIFFENEFSYDDYSIFSREIPQPFINEEMEITTINESSMIKVETVDILNTSSSSVIHLGSSTSINAEARIKHIRHLLREDTEK